VLARASQAYDEGSIPFTRFRFFNGSTTVGSEAGSDSWRVWVSCRRGVFVPAMAWVPFWLWARGRRIRVPGVDPLPLPLDAYRPQALDRESRSTTSWPVLAWGLVTSAALAPWAGSAPPPGGAMPLTACRFQPVTRVSAPLIAGGATVALTSADYRLRVVCPAPPGSVGSRTRYHPVRVSGATAVSVRQGRPERSPGRP